MRTKTEASEWFGVTKEELLGSKLGVHVKKMVAHRSETQENRKLASQLMERWSRVIFSLSKNYKELAHLEQCSKRRATFKADEYVVPADQKKYQKNANGEMERFYPDRNVDGEALPTRCRLPKTLMADFVTRPKTETVTAKKTSDAAAIMSRHVRRIRATATDRAVHISIEGSSSTLKAEDRD